MITRLWLTVVLAEAVFLVYLPSQPAQACCPAPPSGKPVVNADQTILMIWDAATKTQHFIRQASFKSDADDFGFLVPSPTQPELAEAGNGGFTHLRKLTEPEHKKVPRPSGGIGCGCGAAGVKSLAPGSAPPVRVLEEKMVAGLHAVVLEADSATALVDWLKEHGYAFSPEVRAWAKPYVEKGWKITALRVAKRADSKEAKDVAATALRMSFKTDRPLFPYREPETQKSAEALGARNRLLRIYFIAEARYRGELTPETPWTGRVAWAGKISESDRKTVLEQLKLPETTGPAEWWLTEFEDDWPYRPAPADVTFSRSPTQDEIRRPPILEYVAAPFPAEAMIYALAAVVVLPPLARRRKRGNTHR
ncbi:MAG TPA: DUF2330 domain-containing protein [Gemmataceae bacterium]|jgi:hypothetical protein